MERASPTRKLFPEEEAFSTQVARARMPPVTLRVCLGRVSDDDDDEGLSWWC
jgi:hypothetical protein